MVEVELDDEAYEEGEQPAGAEAQEPEKAMELDDPYGAGLAEEPPASDAAPQVKETKLAERELDEPEAGPKGVQHAVQLNAADATPDVFVSAASGTAASLSQGGFQHLRSGVRADTGAKAGRYLFEVKVLECDPRAENELRVGFSTARSSLFLGDGSPENVCFSSEGTYFLADPGQAKAFEKAGACERMTPQKVVGVLLNLDPESPNSMTVSIFLDGERAGKPQPVPAHLRGKALYPTLTFRNLTLAVNFGQRGLQLRALPFSCRLFGEVAEAHHERSPLQSSADDRLEVVIPVGLPDRGVFDFAERFVEEHPGHVELSDRKVFDWCRRSGLAAKRGPGEGHSRDRPDFNFGISQLDSRAWRDNLRLLVQMAGKSCVLPEVRAGLLKDERKELLSKFPPSVKKVAVVLVGEPDAPFKDWVHGKVTAEYEGKKALVQKRIDIAEASGEELTEEERKMPEEPALGDFLPAEGGVADLSEKAATGAYSRFSLPSAEEGFDEVRFEWLPKGEAEEYLSKWVTEKKATLIVDDLQPGTWFQERQQEWHKIRQDLRTNFSKYKSGGAEEGTDVNSLKVEDIEDVHSCDGEGTPLYANFKYEDWLMLSWRYELHLLVHAFLEDVADPDYKGIPQDHVAHYFSLYYNTNFDPKGKLGASDLAAVVKLLKAPLELVEVKPGYKVLRSSLPMAAAAADFVRGIEGYRRDRSRRVEAGDESARLNFPKPAVKAAPAKAAAKPGVAKASPVKAAPAKAPLAKTAPVKAAPAKAPVAKAPLAKTPAAKRPIVVEEEEAAAKKPRPADAGTPTPRGAAMVNRATGVPLAKAPADGTPTPRGAAMVKRATGAPLAKAPVAKRKP